MVNTNSNHVKLIGNEGITKYKTFNDIKAFLAHVNPPQPMINFNSCDSGFHFLFTFTELSVQKETSTLKQSVEQLAAVWVSFIVWSTI